MCKGDIFVRPSLCQLVCLPIIKNMSSVMSTLMFLAVALPLGACVGVSCWLLRGAMACSVRLLPVTNATVSLSLSRLPPLRRVCRAASQEAVHALGEKHSGLGKVLENAGVRETHDIAGLKQTMQVRNERTLGQREARYNSNRLGFFFFCVLVGRCFVVLL